MTPEQEELRRRAWEYHKEADYLFAARFNYSMVAQSMLLVSFATLFTSGRSVYVIVSEVVIAMFGIWYTWNQYLLSRSLVSKMEFLKKQYLVADDIYKKYLDEKPGRPSGIQTRRIPFALVLVWLTLLLAALFGKYPVDVP